MELRGVNGIDLTDKKCTCCGNSELVHHFIMINSTQERGQSKAKEAETFICTKCGHVEWFVPPRVIQQAVRDHERARDFFEKRDE